MFTHKIYSLKEATAENLRKIGCGIDFLFLFVKTLKKAKENSTPQKLTNLPRFCKVVFVGFYDSTIFANFAARGAASEAAGSGSI